MKAFRDGESDSFQADVSVRVSGYRCQKEEEEETKERKPTPLILLCQESSVERTNLHWHAILKLPGLESARLRSFLKFPNDMLAIRRFLAYRPEL